jgi:Domain of unknown function (DUF1992)
VTERRPTRRDFESWIDAQIREGMDRGEFDNLPGAGKPIADLGETHDELWWVKQKLKRENVSYLPPSLVLRKEAEDARAAAAQADSEAEVHRIITGINAKIREAIRKPPDGPPLNLMPFDVERILARWRTERAVAEQPAGNPISEETLPETKAARRESWWRRALRPHRPQPG